MKKHSYCTLDCSRSDSQVFFSPCPSLLTGLVGSGSLSLLVMIVHLKIGKMCRLDVDIERRT